MPSSRINEYLKKYGSFPIAYSAVYDDEMKYFEAEEGFIPYVDTKAERVALGDPLCATADLESLIVKFLNHAKADHRSPVVLQCGLETARKFAAHGFNANHMGVETNLKVATFSPEGKALSKVRRWINGARNAGVQITEMSMQEPATIQTIGAVSEEWLRGKINQTELRLLTRPLKLEYEPDTRLFCGVVENKIVAFVIFEPMYRDNKITGYYADFVRALDGAPNGTMDLIYHEAMAIFRGEGVEILSFGLSPLADQQDIEDLHNPIVASIFRINYNQGNDMYAYQGLDAHKKAYCDGINGIREPKFLVVGGALPLNQMMNVFNYIGILPEQSYLASIRFFGGCIVKELFSGRAKTAPAADQKQVTGIIDDMIKGVPTGEIAQKNEMQKSAVSKLLDKITSGFKKLSPEIEKQALFFYGNFNDETEKLYVKVSNIADSEKDIHFVHNIFFMPQEKGYAVAFTAETSPELTVKDTYRLITGLRKKIAKKIPEITYVHVEFEPDGTFYEMLEERTLANTTDEDFA